MQSSITPGPHLAGWLARDRAFVVMQGQRRERRFPGREPYPAVGAENQGRNTECDEMRAFCDPQECSVDGCLDSNVISVDERCAGMPPYCEHHFNVAAGREPCI